MIKKNGKFCAMLFAATILIVGAVIYFYSTNDTVPVLDLESAVQPNYKKSIGELPLGWSIGYLQGKPGEVSDIDFEGNKVDWFLSEYAPFFQAGPDYVCQVGECGDSYQIAVSAFKGSDLSKYVESQKKYYLSRDVNLDAMYGERTDIDEKEIAGKIVTSFTSYGSKFNGAKEYYIRWSDSDKGLYVFCYAPDGGICEHFIDTFDFALVNDFFYDL
jgi:hypothetical protein